MRILRDHASLPAAARGASVAIGNFDGLHRGHRSVIRTAAQLARELGAPLGVVTFEPHPREVLAPERAPARLTPLRRKAELLRELGVNLLYVLRFDRRLMAMPAEAFVETLLVEELGVRAVTTGRDFRFGHRRAGDTALLAELGARHGIPVRAVQPVVGAGDLVCSSTAIRTALADGDVALATDLLGEPFEVVGKVRGGDRRGRELGFPTANVHPFGRRPMLPAIGVYAVRAGLCRPGGNGGDGCLAWRPAAAYLGRRPTFDGRSVLLEVHLLDADGPLDLYGQRLRVAFLQRLRGEHKFTSVEALTAQIARDVSRARAVHAHIPA